MERGEGGIGRAASVWCLRARGILVERRAQEEQGVEQARAPVQELAPVFGVGCCGWRRERERDAERGGEQGCAARACAVGEGRSWRGGGGGGEVVQLVEEDEGCGADAGVEEGDLGAGCRYREGVGGECVSQLRVGYKEEVVGLQDWEGGGE